MSPATLPSTPPVGAVMGELSMSMSGPGCTAMQHHRRGRCPNREGDHVSVSDVSEFEGAQCRFDPELHTGPPEGVFEPPAARRAREQVAREVCEGCPVLGACLEYALRLRPQVGIWAGLNVEEIATLAGALGRGAGGLFEGEAA